MRVSTGTTIVGLKQEVPERKYFSSPLYFTIITVKLVRIIHQCF